MIGLQGRVKKGYSVYRPTCYADCGKHTVTDAEGNFICWSESRPFCLTFGWCARDTPRQVIEEAAVGMMRRTVFQGEPAGRLSPCGVQYAASVGLRRGRDTRPATPPTRRRVKPRVTPFKSAVPRYAQQAGGMIGMTLDGEGWVRCCGHNANAVR